MIAMALAVAPEETQKRSLQMAKEILCAFGVDIDAVAGWLAHTAAKTYPLTFSAVCSRARSARQGC